MSIASILIALSAAASDVVEVPAATAAGAAYESVSNVFWTADMLVWVLLPLLLLCSGLGSRICNAIARRVGHRRYPTLILFSGVLLLLIQLIRALIDFFWVRAHDHALAAQPTAVADWLLGELRDSLFLIIGGVVAITAVYWLMGKSPRRWWLYASFTGAGIVLCALLMQPLTMDYAPLGERPVAAKITALANRIGISADRIGVQQADDQSGCGAATVVGLGPTRHVLLDDALLDHYTDGEIIESVAHESKHFIRDDNIKAMLLISGWLLCALWLVARLGNWLARRWRSAFGFASVAEPAGLPLAMLIFALAYLVALPFGRAFQRTIIEQAADRFALDTTGDNFSEAMLYVKDAKCYPLLVPAPGYFYRLFRATHPSLEQRIEFANSYSGRSAAP